MPLDMDHNMIPETLLLESVQKNVTAALDEDLGPGDVTASLIDKNPLITANVISRQNAVFCGKFWVEETARQLDTKINLKWIVDDGDQIVSDQLLFSLSGPAQSILSAERTILNFCQLLSGTATKAYHYAQYVDQKSTQILDTRKTLPGLRIAQKYAVQCGGCTNHRLGLFDAYLIKENHIISCGGIFNAVKTAQEKHADLKIEVEVENIEELLEAIDAGADIAMIDNFSSDMTNQAVEIANGKIKLEASGGIDLDSIAKISATGVDYISVGALTKEITPIDLSMRFEEQILGSSAGAK